MSRCQNNLKRPRRISSNMKTELPLFPFPITKCINLFTSHVSICLPRAFHQQGYQSQSAGYQADRFGGLQGGFGFVVGRGEDTLVCCREWQNYREGSYYMCSA